MYATTNLPDLTGSEKQLPWATEIREKAIPAMRATREWIAEDLAHLEDLDELLAGWDRLVARYLAQTNAGWWIDNRNRLHNAGEDMATDAHFGVWMRECGYNYMRVICG